MGDPIAVDAEQLDTPRVGAEVGTHPVERGLHAGEHIVGVQVVQHEQVADDLVVREPAHQVLPDGVVDELEDPVEPGAVQAS